MSIGSQQSGIVVAVDGSPSSLAAVEWAARDAQMRNAPLLVIHVVAPIVVGTPDWSATEIPADYSELQETEAQEIIEQAHRAAIAAAPSHGEEITSRILHDQPVAALVALSESAQLMVVGCRGQGAIAQALLGSVSGGVAHHAHCPVAIIHQHERPGTPNPSAPVVVGIDGSPASEQATEIAFDEASRRGVDLVAVHAWSDMGPLGVASIDWAPIEWRNIKVAEEEVLAERLSGWRERYPDVAVHKIVVCDQPGLRLLEQGEIAQLVVLGSHGRGGFAGMLLGSVCTAVVHNAGVPVIIARTPGDPSATR